jgi:hypothetical protein
MNKRFAFLMLAAALLVSGCAPKGCRQDRSSGLAQLPAPAYGEARVAGVVRFEGEAPVMKPIEEARHCADIKEEWAVIAEDGGLANVLVYLEDAPISSGQGRERAVLDQAECRFVPRVIGVQIGQPLLAINSDLEFHNVHYAPENNDSNNFGLETYGKKRSIEFDRPEETPISVKCDVHPWMQAYVGVFAHPFFAVTDAAGRYAIERVPAGEYTLKAWHERFGTRQERITVADAGEVVADFTFARRGS